MEHTELDKLIERFQEMVEDEHPMKGYWGQLWNLKKEIFAGFRGVRYPTKEAREKAWQAFQEHISKANARSEAQKTQMEARQREWESRQARSKNIKDGIQSWAESTRPATANERAIAEMVLIPARMVLKILSALGLPTLSEVEEIEAELRKCGESLKEAWQAFNARNSEMLANDRNEAFQSLKLAQDQLNEAWQRWKETKNAARAERQQEREAKHTQFIERIERNIAKNEEKLANANDALERAEARLADLQEKFDTAWNDGYKERCSEWITECEAKIESIKESISRLEGWLEEDKRKLN